MGTVAPLIVTAVLDPASQQRFDDLRRRHFPPERNHLAAHVTLFHALPGGEEEAVAADLADVVDGGYGVDVTGVRFLGRGVAYDLRSPDRQRVRGELGRRWASWLMPQDRQAFRPHVTVQNKVAPDMARRLHVELTASFTPYVVRVEGLALWRYLGGPWEPVGRFRSDG